ncbi:protein-disulfide reductase DsbD [endosymbiont of Lamellibrachia barhami]|uniref:protein-disulfide reductase DsbD n=1 Tax=endosymbiont of Lamellibrachia barhami TaxID=205975 RepID=UPI0015A9B0FB|nr:protein-disulfide reductase DsbD [endosymbiont of Lamellibrachia barhami]
MHNNKFLISLSLLFASLALLLTHANANEEPPPPDQVFPIRVTTDGPDHLLVEWNIADGYYLYRDKIRFETDAIGIELDEPELPAAELKHDEFFGDLPVYRGPVTVRLPIKRSQGSPDTLNLQARSQGCADQGICYPPHLQEVQLKLEPMLIAGDPLTSSTSRTSSLIDNSTPLFANDEGELLAPEEAYKLAVTVEDGTHLRLLWNIADGTYLYYDKIKLQLADNDNVVLGSYTLPEPEIKKDTITPEGKIGDVPVYHDGIDLSVPLIRGSSAAENVTLEVAYQGCAEIGVCYPPIRKTFDLALPTLASTAVATPMQAASTPPPPAAVENQPISELDEIAATLEGSSTLVVVGVFFMLGLGLAFTPCVFPMIPILSGIIAGQGKHITTRKAFTLSLVYVLAMALTYTVAGVLAGLFGENLSAAFQNPWILSTFALIFVLLALSMFGFYELQLPSGLQSKLTDISNKQQGGSLFGVAIMGFLSALIVGPCVAPPLAGALIYIGQTGDAVLGGLALFALSMGMGAPLIAIGTSAGKLLPRAGSWMDAVKAVFGVTMLGVAILMLERIIPADIAMFLWGMLLVVSAIYMGALRHLEIEAGGWQKLWKGLGMVFLIYGALLLVGAAAGGKDTLQPLRGLGFGSGGGEQAAHGLTFKRIKNLDDLQREVRVASTAGKSVMLDFYADWCISCKEMEKYTFSDPEVIAALRNTVLLQADVTANDAQDKALLQGHFGMPGPPAIFFYGSDGKERKAYRVVGYQEAGVFAPHVREAVR